MLTRTRRLDSSDIERADAIWAEYAGSHDLADRIGETAGIDPESGHIWFADSILDITRQQDAEGMPAPLLFVRVGSEFYYRKGGRR